ncbi:hypothetical protein K0M31_010788, partial [Melipona bicolor]
FWDIYQHVEWIQSVDSRGIPKIYFENKVRNVEPPDGLEYLKTAASEKRGRWKFLGMIREVPSELFISLTFSSLEHFQESLQLRKLTN